MLLHLAGQTDVDALVIAVNLDGVVDFRQVAFVELGVEGRADDLHNAAGFVGGCVSVGSRGHE